MRYFYLKTINNNAIVCLDENRTETVILGKGIGVIQGKFLGCEIDRNRIERVFTKNNEYIEPLLKDVPYSVYQLVQEIIDNASFEFKYDFKDSLFLTLLDHIVFSVKRLDDNVPIINPLLSEIKMFEKDKFDFAIKMVSKINAELKTEFDENEAGFIAFHFVNAMSDLDYEENKKIVQILKSMSDFIQIILGEKIQLESYFYERMIRHIRFLLIRSIKKINVEKGVDNHFADIIKKNYVKEWSVACEIGDFLSLKHKISISKQEIVYLTLHVVPLFEKSKGEN